MGKRVKTKNPFYYLPHIDFRLLKIGWQIQEGKLIPLCSNILLLSSSFSEMKGHSQARRTIWSPGGAALLTALPRWWRFPPLSQRLRLATLQISAVSGISFIQSWAIYYDEWNENFFWVSSFLTTIDQSSTLTTLDTVPVCFSIFPPFSLHCLK